jgi:hypothetical protein
MDIQVSQLQGGQSGTRHVRFATPFVVSRELL